MYIHRTELGHAGALLQLRSRSTFLQFISRVQRSPGTLFVILFFLISPFPFPSFSLSPRMVRSFLTIVLAVVPYSSRRSVDH